MEENALEVHLKDSKDDFGLDDNFNMNHYEQGQHDMVETNIEKEIVKEKEIVNKIEKGNTKKKRNKKGKKKK